MGYSINVYRVNIKQITKTPGFLFEGDFILIRSSEKLVLNILNFEDKIFIKKKKDYHEK